MLVELMSLIVRKVCMNSKQFIMSGLCRSYAVSSETYNFHALTEIAALCLKLCHLKDKNVTWFTVFKVTQITDRKEGGEVGKG
jgi:hypothetical protein